MGLRSLYHRRRCYENSIRLDRLLHSSISIFHIIINFKKKENFVGSCRFPKIGHDKTRIFCGRRLECSVVKEPPLQTAYKSHELRELK